MMVCLGVRVSIARYNSIGAIIMKSNPRSQAGLKLIELLLVLAIVTAIAIGAFIIYPRVQASRAATAESTTLTFTVAQVQGIYTQGNYQTLSNTVAVQADMFRVLPR